jgi:glyoxylase-like metal-dependent hydrolase (beta-lactamase superfamily II)
VTLVWEPLADGAFRCRLPYLDVTVGLVCGRDGAVLIDSGTTLTEARAIEADMRDIAGRGISHIVLTHNHFDHILGASAFAGVEMYCAPEVSATMSELTDHRRADALRYGADSDPLAWPVTLDRVIDAGGRDAVYVPGHGAVVDAAFISPQRDWLRRL